MLGEKEESQIFLVLPGGLTGFCCTSRGNGTTWEPWALVTSDLCLLSKGVAFLSHTHQTFWGTV